MSLKLQKIVSSSDQTVIVVLIFYLNLKESQESTHPQNPVQNPYTL